MNRPSTNQTTTPNDNGGTESSADLPGFTRWYRWPADPSLRNVPADTPRLRGIPSSPAGLQEKTVTLIGLGAVGGEAFGELARAGVGRLIGIDPDKYGRESWMTQPVCRRQDVACPKAYVQGRRAHGVNPAVEVVTISAAVQDVPYWIFRHSDVLLVAADNAAAVVWAGTMAMAFGKPLIQGAVHGETWLASVRSFALENPDAACPGCTLGPEWSTLGIRMGCDLGAVPPEAVEPTRTLSCVCRTAGSLLCAEAIKRLLGMKAVGLDGGEACYSLLTHKAWRTAFTRNPSCACPHAQWRVVDLAEAPHQVTLARLVDRLGISSPAAVIIEGERPWISFTGCPSCQRTPITVRRFGRAGQRVGRCQCGRSLVALPAGIRSAIPIDDLLHCADESLLRLGLEPGSAILVTAGDETNCFFLGTPELPESTGALSYSVKGADDADEPQS